MNGSPGGLSTLIVSDNMKGLDYQDVVKTLIISDIMKGLDNQGMKEWA
jgi:hypothetical protein